MLLSIIILKMLCACRSKIHYLTLEIYRSENYFYCGHSYIARYDERIRFNGQTNDRCAADRELEIRGTQSLSHSNTAKVISYIGK